MDCFFYYCRHHNWLSVFQRKHYRNPNGWDRGDYFGIGDDKFEVIFVMRRTEFILINRSLHLHILSLCVA